MSLTTELVVRRHVQAFAEQQGIDAILRDYAEDARLVSEDRIYLGKTEIREFFVALHAALPTEAVAGFALRCLRADGDLALITWSAGAHIPLGTDTFVVRDGKILSQTVAMHAPAAQ
jgi:ketosteroid isomerase-like protein